jgi:hypothetical protein
MADFLAPCWSKLFPVSRRRESIKIEEGMTVQDGVRDANNTLQPNECFLIEFVPTQQIRVIAKIAQEPAQPPERFGCAIDAPSEGMAQLLFGFNHGQSHQVKRPGRVPPVKRSIHLDEEGTFEMIGTISAFAMQAWNMAFHEVTSCDLE